MPMALGDFTYVKNMVQEHAANVLESQRDYIVESRLQVLAERVGVKSVPSLIARLRDANDETLHRQVVDALVNNETMFFRDVTPFDTLREHILPELMSRQGRERTLNIWSAACSSGQEPYSVAMVIAEHFPQMLDWQVRILATDLSQTILARAASGLYSQIEVNRGLPARYLVKYFERRGLQWQLKDPIRRMVHFKPVNLAQPLPPLPRMDIILLRNALIYFDVNNKRRTLSEVERILKPGGYLILGSAETTISLSDAFDRVYDRAACYRLKGT